MDIAPKKRPLEAHEFLLWSAPQRPPRKEREPLTRSAPRSSSSSAEAQLADDEAEGLRHRQAIQEYRDRCDTSSAWVCAEALLYICDGDRIVERYALWLFPSEADRFLVSTCTTRDDHRRVQEFYVLVRLEGRACLSKISLGVCQTGPESFQSASATPGAPLEVDPTAGHVLRIVSIEKDGEPLHHPEDASPYLQNAKHIREVIRKHAAKCDHLSSSETLHYRFNVLRTRAYLDAKEAIEREDCDSDTWSANITALEDPSSFPWHLANRVSELGTRGTTLLEQAEAALPPRGTVHVVDDIWLVDEELPLSSSEFVVAGRWAIQKSIKGTGSIPRAKMWEPVVVIGREGHGEFRLLRMA
jgi:hypothetical protein